MKFIDIFRWLIVYGTVYLLLYVLMMNMNCEDLLCAVLLFSADLNWNVARIIMIYEDY